MQPPATRAVFDEPPSDPHPDPRRERHPARRVAGDAAAAGQPVGRDMRGATAAIALLLALVVVGVLAMKAALAPGHAGSAPAAAGTAIAASSSITAAGRASQLKNEARDGVTKAMSEAEARRQQADKP